MKAFGDIFSLPMKSFEQIRLALIEQKQEFINQNPGTTRNLLTVVARYVKTPFPVIISGLRRAGKSTLLAQLARRFYPNGNYFYVNFEDERFLAFSARILPGFMNCSSSFWQPKGIYF